MKVELNVENTTGWDDYDEKFLQQIEDEGFDSIQLDDDWIVFDPARVKVVGVEDGGIKEEWSSAERKKRKDKCSNPKGFTMKQFCKNQRTKSKKGERKN